VPRKNVGKKGENGHKNGTKRTKTQKITKMNMNLDQHRRAAKQKGLLSNCLHIKHQQQEDVYAKNIDDPSEKLTDKMTNFPLKTNNYKEQTKGYKSV
jgi:hypothetical protein